MSTDSSVNVSTAVDSAVTSAASKAMGSGATATLWGWMTSNEGIAFVGVSLTIIGFVVNLIFQFRRDRRERVLHDARMAALIKARTHGSESEMQ